MRIYISLTANISKLFVLFLIASVPVYAAMYKWVDANGEVHYSQYPPVDVNDAQIIKPPSSVDTEKANQELDVQRKGFDKLREGRLKKAEEQQKENDKLALEKANCEKAKTSLSSFSMRPTVQIVQEDGSRVRATEEERQEKIREANEKIKEWCK